jgi:hypothetical protein
MAEVPFVSEEFQRAFRNTFKGQVSTGRDLHVSDTVIPVVDFTPTASGTSLPSAFQFAINGNSSGVSATTNAFTLITSDSGFHAMDCTAAPNSDEVDLRLTFYDGVSAYTDKWSTKSKLSTIYARVIVFLPANYSCYMTANFSGTGFCAVTNTQLADVNGNLTSPFGYSPQ